MTTRSQPRLANRNFRSAVFLTASVSLLVACSGAEGNAAEAPTVADNATLTPTVVAEPAPLPEPAPAGPDMLSTVGPYGQEPLTHVDAVHGRFAIEQIDGNDTLTVNGTPARYRPEGGMGPMAVEANAGLTLVGVFELPNESVAWAIVIGGTACAGTHLLIPARGGQGMPAQEIPGCDDRGTMRRDGDRIVFEAGGAVGSFADGFVTIESPG